MTLAEENWSRLVCWVTIVWKIGTCLSNLEKYGGELLTFFEPNIATQGTK